MRIPLIISILLLSFSCQNAKEKGKIVVNQQDTVKEFDLLESEYVILPFNTAINRYSIFKGAKPAHISQSELAEIEKIIEAAIKENNKQQNDELIKHNKTYPDDQLTETGFELKPEGFKRQYVPVINEKGEKEIWINFFCNDRGSEKWKSEIMIVEDGGNCYFNLKVNLTAKTYSELRVNGHA